MKYIIYLLTVFIFFSACSVKPSSKLKSISYGKYQETNFDSLPSWENEDFNKSLELFRKTCKIAVKKELYKGVCKKLHENINAKEFFEKNFTPFKALSQNSLATGYFEPSLKGSLTQTQEYKYPVYGIPKDMLHIELIDDYKISKPIRGRLKDGKVVPYYSRAEINSGSLDAKVLCFVKDKIELFFLQVQGSGIIELDNNKSIYLGYADQNGYPYHSIGKEMINRGLLKREEVSLQSINRFLHEKPDLCDDILESNPSYVFFEKRQNRATGSLGIVLEAGRSVAVDRKNIPLAMPLYISTKEPLTGKKYEKIVFAHDTGGAIKGESRIDIFFGSGERAREQAGYMKNKLDLWMLVPNDYLSKYK